MNRLSRGIEDSYNKFMKYKLPALFFLILIASIPLLLLFSPNFLATVLFLIVVTSVAVIFTRDWEKLNTTIKSLQEAQLATTVERNKLSVILSGITDAVIAVNTKSEITTFNKAAEELTGYTSSEILGKSLGEVCKLFDSKEELPLSLYSPSNTDSFEGVVFNRNNLKLVGKDNKESFVNIISSQIREGSEVNLGCILTLHDVGKEKQLEDMKLDFVSMAAHELRTPLTSLKGYLYVFLRDYKQNMDEKQHTIINRVNIATQRIVSLMENLLNVTRIEKGALTIHLENVDWVENVKEVINELIDQAKDKKMDFVFEEPTEEISQIMVDRFRINEVLSNLISNAINYTQPGGKIRVWIEKKDSDIVTHISDSGEGIPAQAIPHLFTKFFRVSGKLEQGSKGTGLGLYIAKSIVDMHKGKIWVESVFGKGSTFSFSLPLYRQQTPPAEPKI